MKQAIHFGGGNIGRGFIGELLVRSGYEVTFVDVAEALVDEINARRSYDIEVVGNAPKTIHVAHVKAINSNVNLEELLDAFVTADIVTTAIGPNILKFIAPNIAKGLARRVEKNETPLNIIACENMVGGSTVLKNFVYEHLDESTKEKVMRCIGFPDAAVDRIVPIQHNEDPLLVKVEPFAEWDVDRKGVVGSEPQIEGLTWVDDLEAYIERKLFSVNTGHASIAYMAYLKGIEDIASAMKDEEIVSFVRRVWAETSELLIEKYGFDREKHAAYIRTAEERFTNPHLSDAVTRVARGPKRKLGVKDRLVSPAAQLIERGRKPEALATVIAAALRFDFVDDPEAVEVQGYIKEHGFEKALMHFTEIPPGSELFNLILDKNAELKK
ncbi:mannitol dehydrogenase domain protein [Selenomonas sp. oral taxon 892 str. F0426]|uniref:mannitol-1-phosphate 5-dehydrogenase n=1 Tax=Selenomonas sp. oral taxon 892 TaxID=1321785 RepID=UPI0003AD3FBA|nr:mannitol-1-phosphate 5-dehydrogenase [Selenomonas sp. oral taxon 892]ERJ96060.1 mannitol dehydrogenase domain protein [Selenomonas sp. oral taxon 892 str. F0426]